ncbi:SusC/RagA family TonB-linked outer membrane protein, partial [Fusobacterium necrophorum]
MEVKQPIYTGWNTLLRNAGEIRNRGLEVTLGATPVRTKDWDWRTDLTLSHNKGTFEQIPTITKMQTQGNGKFESLIFRMIEGEKLGTFYGYTYDGVWKTNEVNQVANIQGNTDNKTNAEVYG